MTSHEEQIWQSARGFQASRILLSAVELNVFGALGEESRSSAEVAAFIGADPRGTDRLMDALVALGWLEKTDGLFANGSAALECLLPGRPGDITGALMHTNGLYHRWGRLTESVRAGTATEPGPQKPEDRTEAFIAAMHANASERAPEVISRLDLDGVSRVLDVGGGSGAYAIALCRARPGIEAVVFDLPDVVPLTQRYVVQSGLSGCVHTVAGSYHESDLGEGFDLVLLNAILHSNSAEENTALLHRCRKALKPGGRVAIQDFVMDEDRTSPPRGAVFALNMLVNTEAGDTFTEHEIAGWLKTAGFGTPHRIDVPAAGTALLIAEAR